MTKGRNLARAQLRHGRTHVANDSSPILSDINLGTEG